MDNFGDDSNFNEDKEENFDESENKDGCCNGKNIFVAITKGASCCLLGVVLTASHYVFDLIAAPVGTIARTIAGCKNLYSKTNPEGFFQHVWYTFKVLPLVIYNSVKLPFLVVYRATFGLIEDAVGIIKPMCCVFRGDEIKNKVKKKIPCCENEFDFDKDGSSIDFIVCFALAIVEFESPLFNNSKEHGNFKKFFTKIWDTVHVKFGKFAAWLLLPKKIYNSTLSTGVDDNNDDGIGGGESFLFGVEKNDKFDIFDDILHPLKKLSR